MVNKKYIYIYKVDDSEDNPKYNGWVKIGQTDKQPAERVDEQAKGQTRLELQLL
jgi:hypothetical protein